MSIVILAMILVVMTALASFATPFGGGSQDGTQPPPTTNPPSNPPGPGGPSTTPTYAYWTFLSVPAGSGLVQEGCAASNGKGGTYVGVRFRYRYPYGLGLTAVQNAIRSGQAAMNELGIVRLSTRCLYDGAWTDVTIRCVLSSTAEVTMRAPRQKSLATKTTTSAYGSGDKSINACQNSRAQAYVTVQLKEYGQYRVNAHSLAVNMVIRRATAPNDLTGVWEADRIVSTSAPFRTNPMSRDGYLTCSGFFNGTPSRAVSWTADDCDPTLDPPNVRIQCADLGSDAAIEHPAMKRERLTHVQMLGSGEPFYVQWNTPRVTSSTGNIVSVDATRTRLLKSGDWLAGKQWNQQNAEARLPNQTRTAIRDKSGTTFMTGVQTRWEFNLYGAQDQVFQPEYIFNLTTRVTSVTIDGLDENGNFITRTTTINVPTTRTCRGPEVTLEALRVINQP